MKRILLTAAAVALFADGAAAQQADPLQDPTPAGFRAELIAGYDRDGSEDGAVYGARLGYDLPVAPRVLLGIEGEFTDVTTEQQLSFPPTSLTVGDGPDLYVGARATFMISDRIGIHAGLGYTRARHGSFFLEPNGSFGSQEVFHDGFRASAGAQFLLSSQVFLGIEYRRSDYEQGFERAQTTGSIGFRF